MKRILFSFVILFSYTNLTAQVSVNADGSPPPSSAMFEVKSSNKGFLPPRMTWPQIQAIQNPVAGLVVYDEGLKSLRMYDGNRWIVIGAREYEITDPPGNFSTTIITASGLNACNAVEMGSNKRVIIAGWFINLLIFGNDTLNSPGAYSTYLAAFDSSGTYLWAKKITSTNTSSPDDIKISPTGEILICGAFIGSIDFDPGPGVVNHTSGFSSPFFAKYDANGNLIWAKNLPTSNTSSGSSIALEANGNIYITGTFTGTIDTDPGPGSQLLTSPTGTDGYFAKYNSNGEFIWSKKIGGATTNDSSTDLILLNTTLVLAGAFSGTVDFDPSGGLYNLTSAGTNDFFLARYDTSGAIFWAKAIGTAGAEAVVNLQMTSDPAGAILLGGVFTGQIDVDPDAGTVSFISAGGSQDFFLAKYSSSGGLVLNSAIKIGNTGTEYLLDLRTDNTGNIYLTGQFDASIDFNPDLLLAANRDPVGGIDAFLVKLSSANLFLFAATLGGTGTDVSYDIAVDPSGKLIFAGGTVTSAPWISFNRERFNTVGIFFCRYEE